MRTTSFCRTAVCAVILCCACTWAQEVQDLGVTEVSAPVSAGVAVSGTGYTEILPSAWEGRGLSAAEVLSSLSGVQGYKQGGMGSFQTVSVRGIAARNILICLDGMPLNDAGGGAVDLGSMDLNNIEKIEIYKDRVPAKFGGAGIGGVINFVSKNAIRASRVPSGRVLASYGSHNTFEGSAQVNSFITDSAQFSATASMRHSDNDYEFDNRNGTLYNDEDDFKDKRRNAQFTEYSGNLQYRMLHRFGFFSTLTGNIMHTEAGNPGTEDLQTYLASFTGDMAQLMYRLESPEYLECLLLEMGMGMRFEKNMSESYYPLDKIGFLSRDVREIGLAGYRLLPELSATLTLDRFEAFLRLAGTSERWEARGTIHEFGLERYTGSVAGSMEFFILRWFSIMTEGNVLKTIDDVDGGKFLMTTGLAKVEDGRERNLSWSGMAQANLGEKDSWFGGSVSFGRFFRQPQLMELYGVYPGTLSSPTLRDETALRFAAGAFVATPKKRSVLRATYFETYVENGIYWIISTNLMKAFNIDKSVVRGVELELDSRPVPFFQTVLRATIQDPRDDGINKAYNGNLLPGEPVHSYYVEGDLFLPFHLSPSFSMDYRSRMFSDRMNDTKQPPVTRYNAALSWHPWDKTRLTFAVNNITDETYRNIFTPHPIPGREYRFTIIQGF